MKTTPRNTFTTVKTEGAILPADLLQRIATGRDVAHLEPESFDLASSERISEAIGRSWARCRGVWESFQQRRADMRPTDSTTTLTRRNWLLILLQELGYHQLPFQQGGIAADDGTRYPISHRADSVPLHLISFEQPLDKRDSSIRRSPHSLLQEYLNRSEASLWGITANGLQLRVLRDNATMTRAAYVEFDLEAMFESEQYADFSLLWLVCHRSRFAVGEDRPIPIIETWSQAAKEQGTRALESLRQGVEQAIAELGAGFLQHPANTALRDALQNGDLPTQEYYRELLRLVYRLIFLFVAEDRDLLLLPDAAPHTRDTYQRHYALSRLRTLAQAMRGGSHPDLYRQLRIVNGLLRTGYAPLGLPALGGFLFSDRSTPHLDDADLANEALLAALRELAFTRQGSVMRQVDYKNLGSEELGSVYESLLELHPQLHVAAGQFTLDSAAGSERKTTGSYYTPSSLINELLNSALEPVVEARLREAREKMKKRGVGSREVGSRGEGNPTRYSLFPTPSNKRSSKHHDSELSRPQNLAEGDGHRGRMLSADEVVSEGRTVRDDIADSQGGIVDSGEHRGGLGSGESRRLHALSSHRTGVSQGVGDPSASVGARGTGNDGENSADSQSLRRGGEDAAGVVEEFGEREVGNRGDDSPTRYSLPTTPSSSPLEEAILNITVVDPACGSGHFLIAAAQRLARHLARVRTGDEEPDPAAQRQAIRDVVRRCIHGVDINEMALELCKVALWMETLDPGKPLGFLGKNIQCGNSLIGATPALLARGIPNEAFKPITGDDRKAASFWKKRNKQERGGQRSMHLEARQPWRRLGDLATAMLEIDRLGNETLADVEAQRTQYADLVNSVDYEINRLWPDAWCAAFVWEKRSEFERPITEQIFRDIERNPYSQRDFWDGIRTLRDQYQFFHWHLAFPHIFTPNPPDDIDEDEVTGWHGGFDVVLGNPPWERVKLQEKEFFAGRDSHISNARNAAARRKLIAELQTVNPLLYADFGRAKRIADGTSHVLRNSAKFPLCGRGDVNTYPIFAELTMHLLTDSGHGGIIVPSGIATDSSTQEYFGELLRRKMLISLFGFTNWEFIFPTIGDRFSFCLLTVCGDSILEETPSFAFHIHNTSQLKESERLFNLSYEDIKLLNPNTLNCPIFRTKFDAEVTKEIYRTTPIFMNERTHTNPWLASFRRVFDMTNDSGMFEMENSHSTVPLYEAKMFSIFNHRHGTYTPAMLSSGQTNFKIIPTPHEKDLARPDYEVMSRFSVNAEEVAMRLAKYKWSHRWLLCFRGITLAVNERTVIASILPFTAVGNSAPSITSEIADKRLLVCLLANLNSLTFDYVARQKVGATNFNFFIFKQLPVIEPKQYSLSEVAFIVRRVLELVFTTWVLRDFALDMGYLGSPFEWNVDRRFLIQAELDSFFALKYGLKRLQTEYLLDPSDVFGDSFPSETFRVLKENELKLHGVYRTKEAILEIYDEMAEAMRTGVPYQTRLDPPPGDPRAAHPWDEARLGPELPMDQWWRKDEGGRMKDEAGGEVLAVSRESSSVGLSEPETLEMRRPQPVAAKKPKKSRAKKQQAAPQLPLPGSYTFTPPAGDRMTRQKRVMKIGTPKNDAELHELIAALTDDNATIVWLAAASVARLHTPRAVAALRAFLQTDLPAAAADEARKVLLIIEESMGGEREWGIENRE